MRHAQRGNAVVIILVGIALFGALAATFMRGAKTGQGNLTVQQSKMVATYMTGYGASMQRAIDKLRSKGCSEGEISFETLELPSYANPKTPADGSCKVFDVTGGGMQLPVIESSWLSHPTNIFATKTYFTGTARVDGIGTSATDLLLLIFFPKLEICEQINSLSGITPGTYMDDGITNVTFANEAWFFTGTYMGAGMGVLGNDDIRFAGKDRGCFFRNGYYMYYQVLIAR